MGSSQEAFAKAQSQAPLGEVQSACCSGFGEEDHRQPPLTAPTQTTWLGAGHAPLSGVSSFFTTVINTKLAIFTYLSTDRF